jgi:hypothetical protein
MRSILCLLAGLIASPSMAWGQTPIAVAKRWGWIGMWAVDCKVGPSQSLNWILIEARKDALYYVRDAGDQQYDNKVVAAAIEKDGTLEASIVFTEFQPPEMRLQVNVHDIAGRWRNVTNQNTETGEILVAGGIRKSDSKPTLWLHRCAVKGARPEA